MPNSAQRRHHAPPARTSARPPTRRSAQTREAQRDRGERCGDHGVRRLTRKMPAATVASAISSRAVTGSASSSAPRTQAEHRRQHRERREPRRRVVADQPEPDQVAREADDRRSGRRASPRRAATGGRQRRARRRARADEQQQRRDGELVEQRLLGRRLARATWRGSPASSRPRARRRATPRRVAEPLQRAGRRPREALGERPGDAREGEHEAGALQPREPLRARDQRHAERDDERRDVDEDDHARRGRELQADEDAEELGARTARRRAGRRRACRRARTAAMPRAARPEPDQDRARRPSAAPPARAPAPPAAPPSRRPGSGPRGSSRGRAMTTARRRDGLLRRSAARLTAPLLRKGFQVLPPRFAPLPPRGRGGLLRSPFSASMQRSRFDERRASSAGDEAAGVRERRGGDVPAGGMAQRRAPRRLAQRP